MVSSLNVPLVCRAKPWRVWLRQEMARPARDGPVESCALARLAFKRAGEMVALGSGAGVVWITALSFGPYGATAEEEGMDCGMGKPALRAVFRAWRSTARRMSLGVINRKFS